MVKGTQTHDRRCHETRLEDQSNDSSLIYFKEVMRSLCSILLQPREKHISDEKGKCQSPLVALFYPSDGKCKRRGDVCAKHKREQPIHVPLFGAGWCDGKQVRAPPQHLGSTPLPLSSCLPNCSTQPLPCLFLLCSESMQEEDGGVDLPVLPL